MTFRGVLVGLELEYFVVDLETLTPVDGLARLDLDVFDGHVKAEACLQQIEVATPAFTSVGELAGWCRWTHGELQRQLGQSRAGLLPLALLDTATLDLRDEPTFLRLLDVLGPPFARFAPLVASDQVNLGAPDGNSAMQALELIRRTLPELTGLAVASPLLQGTANGIAGNRMAVADQAATEHPAIVGFPERLPTLDHHARTVAELAPFHTEKGYYKYVRPMPSRGVAAEIRALDKQPTLQRSLAFAAAGLGLLRAALSAGTEVAGPDPGDLPARFERARRAGMVDVEATRRVLMLAAGHLSPDERALLSPLTDQTDGARGPAHRLLDRVTAGGVEEAYRELAAEFSRTAVRTGQLR